MLANWHSLHQDAIVIFSSVCFDIATRVRAKISEFVEHSPIPPTEPKARANQQSLPEGCCGFPGMLQSHPCSRGMERRNGWEFINYGMDLIPCLGRAHHYDGPQNVLRPKTV